jgi:predicted Rossmann fold nucleotide-binding protein DprA/Smf involved in DNA uptake
MTFGSGYKTYYRQIVEGDVLVLSTFFPKAPWRTDLAMARNPIIYGLASEIYVAESSEGGGTWSGVMDGLRKNRVIFVRMPGPSESNANNLLISKGAIAVDFEGNPIQQYRTVENSPTLPLVSEPDPAEEQAILALLKKGPLTAKEIISRLNLTMSERNLRAFLEAHKDVETVKGRTVKYAIKPDTVQQSLFD